MIHRQQLIGCGPWKKFDSVIEQMGNDAQDVLVLPCQRIRGKFGLAAGRIHKVQRNSKLSCILESDSCPGIAKIFQYVTIDNRDEIGGTHHVRLR